MTTNIKEPILYVDDEKENLQSFNYLMRRDFHVLLASSANEGIEILRNKAVKVVLTDQRMPVTTGIEFLELVLKEFPDVIRMITSAYYDTETVLQAINLGKIFHYVNKPWDSNELKKILNIAVATFVWSSSIGRTLSELYSMIFVHFSTSAFALSLLIYD